MVDTHKLSNSIPTDIAEKIAANGKENPHQIVYRVAKRGNIDETAFLSTYEEDMLDNGKLREGRDPNNISTYSTSCYLSRKRPQKFLGYLKQQLINIYPHPILMTGRTICGLSQLTAEREPDTPESDHVDWWIYPDYAETIAGSFYPVEEVQ